MLIQVLGAGGTGTRTGAIGVHGDDQPRPGKVVLRPQVFEAAIAEAVRRAEADVAPPGPAPSDVSRLEDIERQVERLTGAIASGGELASFLARVQALEAERTQIVQVVEAARQSASTVRSAGRSWIASSERD